MENIPDLPQDAQPSAEAPRGGAEPAGFWIRAGAYTIDGIIILIPSIILSAAVSLAGLPSALGMVLLNILPLALSAAYFIYMPVTCGGQTVGKMAAGVAIIRTDGTGLSYGRAFGRWIGYILNSLLCNLGYLAAAFTKHKRGLHDYVADTRVVYIQPISNGRKAAVIIVGLLIPMMALLGIIAAIAIPKFSNLTRLSNEGATKGNLGAMRSALAIYYGDKKGYYPQNILALTEGGKYLSTIPTLKTPPHHPPSNEVEIYGAEVCSGSSEYGASLKGRNLRDTGKWGYVADPNAHCFGELFVDCTHQDAKGKAWHSY